MANTSYSNEIASPEVEIASEATGGFFSADVKNRHADLKAMLDSSKDNLKLEAMKRIITMVAKGKDASDLFPAVVKNVAAKNHELKKLVYVYLARYAEEQQDLALLSISTFQRALKDPNQLIRASALRVLSSIRIAMIVPIMMLAIKESVRDMSSYVRKTAAHAIPKLYCLDPEQKDQLIEVIDHLLADRTTLVVGSAVYAFEEVCPERTDLVHKHFRKLCQLLVDVEEWGQVVIINMLTRYARTQFTDPNEGEEVEEKERKFYSSEEDDETESEKSKTPVADVPTTKTSPDPDLALLIRNTKSLLQSRNAAVVLAVSQLYFYLAPKNEIGLIARALVRLLRSHREVQSVVLTNIATISAKRRVQYIISKNMFEPFLKSFFVRTSDPTHIKLLKLEILTNLATQTNISIILREFQQYVSTNDKEFAAATIDAIGRCASNIKDVTDVCLSGLVNLMANRNETVVAQSVVVIKKLLQMQPSKHRDIITSMAKLIDHISVSAARASILWLIGEYCELVPKIAPDVLRKMAKSFINEEEPVKAQILNLAVKLYLTNPEQTQLLVHYIFQLARYDTSYDLRDRARLLKNLVMPQTPNRLTAFAKAVFLTAKPAPMIESRFKDRDEYQLGTLSHYLNQRCAGYNDLPEFPSVAPDPSVRNVETVSSPHGSAVAIEQSFGSAAGGSAKGGRHEKIKPKQPVPAAKPAKAEKFYSDEESEPEDEEEEEEDSEEVSDEDVEENGEVHSDDASDEEEDEEESGIPNESSEKSEAGSESDDESEEEDDESSQDEADASSKAATANMLARKLVDVKKQQLQQNNTNAKPQKKDLLLDFDDDDSLPAATVLPTNFQPLMELSADTFTKVAPNLSQTSDAVTAPAQYTPTAAKELLNRFAGQGLAVTGRFTRAPNLYSNKMCSIDLQFVNHSNKPFSLLRLAEKASINALKFSPLPEVGELDAGQTKSALIGVDFCDSSQAAELELFLDDAKHVLSLSAPFGEQLQPVLVSAATFATCQAKLTGMNEASGFLAVSADLLAINKRKSFCQTVYASANVIEVEGVENKVCFIGQTLSEKHPVYISLMEKNSSEVKLTVNCEKMVVGSMLFKELKAALATKQ